MEGDFDPFKTLRNDFNFAYVCQFLHHFGSAFFSGPDDDTPTTPYLEHMLLYQEDPKKIGQFYLKLLKALPGWRSVSVDTWLEGLAKEYKKRELAVDFPTPAPPSAILTVPIQMRLQMLRSLCDFNLEQPEHFWELLRVQDGESSWRLESIGQDTVQRRYWVTADGRLFRDRDAIDKRKLDGPHAITDESNWELVCLSRADYEDFVGSGLSNRPKDRALLKLMREHVIPQVEPILSRQLALHKKHFQPTNDRLHLLPRKRSSRLVEKEIEEMQRREAEEEERKERIKQQKLARQALLGRDLTPVDSDSGDEAMNLAAERERRVELRRLKREKEAQVKAIEEAFFASMEHHGETADGGDDAAEADLGDGHVDILGGGESMAPPKSPIKLVLKLSMSSRQAEPAIDNNKPLSAVSIDSLDGIQVSRDGMARDGVIPEEGAIDILSEKETARNVTTSETTFDMKRNVMPSEKAFDVARDVTMPAVDGAIDSPLREAEEIPIGSDLESSKVMDVVETDDAHLLRDFAYNLVHSSHLSSDISVLSSDFSQSESLLDKADSTDQDAV